MVLVERTVNNIVDRALLLLSWLHDGWMVVVKPACFLVVL